MKIIITGTTGMIGEGILLSSLDHPAVSEVLSVSRKPSGKQHPKLKEYLVADFLTLTLDDPQLQGYDACFFCAGISSLGIDAAQYKQITYDTTLHFARALQPKEPMTFIYVSGGGTDSSEKGKLAWARVKGKTENDLMKLGFRQTFGFRIGMVQTSHPQMHVLSYYKYLNWLIPILKMLSPNMINTMDEVAKAMIKLAQTTYPNTIIHVKDIHQLAK
ncbi:epimerase [Sphingobacterium sp. HJSM2_6]|uniref:epimerase n=1 Tax=Sphingobacterium sp. HJSM2_6 TaxID=3366264 RepID=UPI003BD8BBB7